MPAPSNPSPSLRASPHGRRCHRPQLIRPDAPRLLPQAAAWLLLLIPWLAAARPCLAQPGTAAEAGTGLVTIESDLQRADNTTGVITALGNVRIVDETRGVIVTARQAQYYSREGRVVLSGDVEIVHRNGHRMQAEQVVYLLDSQRLIARPLAGAQVISRYRIETPASAAAIPAAVPAGQPQVQQP